MTDRDREICQGYEIFTFLLKKKKVVEHEQTGHW